MVPGAASVGIQRDRLAEGIEEFQNSALRLAGRAGDDIDQLSNIAGAEIVLRKVAEKFDVFIDF